MRELYCMPCCSTRAHGQACRQHGVSFFVRSSVCVPAARSPPPPTECGLMRALASYLSIYARTLGCVKGDRSRRSSLESLAQPHVPVGNVYERAREDYCLRAVDTVFAFFFLFPGPAPSFRGAHVPARNRVTSAALSCEIPPTSITITHLAK